MTKLLEQAIAEIEKLPEDAQDAIAARLLADLADEKEWTARFAATTDEQWDRMAALVRQEIEAGDTTPLDDVFSTMASEPIGRRKKRRQFGSAKGMITMADDFDEPLKHFEEYT